MKMKLKAGALDERTGFDILTGKSCPISCVEDARTKAFQGSILRLLDKVYERLSMNWLLGASEDVDNFSIWVL